MYLSRDMDGGPFLVYFLPILGGQKSAVSDSVEGWCAASNLGASRVSIRMDDRTDGQRMTGWTIRWIQGKLHFSSQRPLIYVMIGGPKGEALHLSAESSILGSLHSFNFFVCLFVCFWG
jgi:hypothetical protein